MGLQELGVDSSPILAGAGLLGLAVGLGAQTLVGDVVSGFFHGAQDRPAAPRNRAGE